MTGIAKRGVILGRSPDDGLLLYLGALTGGFWITLLAQGSAVVFVLWLTLRALGYPIWPTLAYFCLGLSLISDVAFFASYLMPDLFAEFTILSCAIACND